MLPSISALQVHPNVIAAGNTPSSSSNRPSPDQIRGSCFEIGSTPPCELVCTTNSHSPVLGSLAQSHWRENQSQMSEIRGRSGGKHWVEVPKFNHLQSLESPVIFVAKQLPKRSNGSGLRVNFESQIPTWKLRQSETVARSSFVARDSAIVNHHFCARQTRTELETTKRGQRPETEVILCRADELMLLNLTNRELAQARYTEMYEIYKIPWQNWRNQWNTRLQTKLVDWPHCRFKIECLKYRAPL